MGVGFGRTGGQFKLASFERDQAWPGERVVLVLRDQVPGKHEHLACGRDNGDLEPSTVLHPVIERPQRSGCFRGSPRRLNQHPSRLRPAGLGDVTMDRWRVAGLTNLGMHSEVRDELVRRFEACEVADSGDDRDRDDHVDPWDRHQSAHRGITYGLFRDREVRFCQLPAKEVQLPQQRDDRGPLILRQRLPFQPGSPGLPEQVRHRRPGHQIAVQHRLHPVLDPSALPHQMSPRCRHPSQHCRPLVGEPDRREEVRCQQLREDPRVDLVGLDLRFRDRAGLQRIRHHHPARIVRQQPRDRVAVARRFQCDLIFGRQRRCPLSQRFRSAAHPARVAHGAADDDRDLREVAVHVHTDESRHHLPLSLVLQEGKGWATDIYGFALSAQPDKSQGRPSTNTGSQPIEQNGLPIPISLGAPVPDGLTVRPNPKVLPARRTTRGTHHFHIRYQRDRVDQRPLPPGRPGARALPERAGGVEVLVLGDTLA